jgi:hypothetical protein
VLALIVSAGCKKAPPPPKVYFYKLDTQNLAGEGGELLLGNTSVGTLAVAGGNEPTLSDAQTATRRVTAEVRMSFPQPVISGTAPLTVRYGTPCGVVTKPVKFLKPTAEEEKQKLDAFGRNGTSMPEIDAMVDPQAPEGPVPHVLVDWGGTNKELKIGELVLAPRKDASQPYAIPGWRCARSHAVTLGGEKIADMDTSAEPKAPFPLVYVISAEPDVCYSMTHVRYAARGQTAPLAGGSALLSGSRVKELPASVAYFLQAAPAQTSSPTGEVLQVLRASCPAPPEPPPAPEKTKTKAKAKPGKGKKR